MSERARQTTGRMSAAQPNTGQSGQTRRHDGLFPLNSAPADHDLTMVESWVEVSSQPSSSSLSSIGDEIVTTGLQVGGPYSRRRRVQTSTRSLNQQRTAIRTADTSSQEECDESESEDDVVMTSSNENVGISSAEDVGADSEAESDDADNVTTLGRAADRPSVFRPQPNAFSHPPSHHRSHSSSAAQANPHGSFTRPSFSQRSQTRVQRGGPNFMSHHSREDNDAALRASLSTLLSCAAAARRLPKSKEEAEAQRMGGVGAGPSSQPMELHLVPESELMQDAPPRTQTPRSSSPLKRVSPAAASPRTATDGEKPKRSSSTGRTSRATKKKRTAITTAEETTFSPTLMTWVVSAGVVVLVSVVGFGAGYVIGREVGHQEAIAAGASSVNETTSCGREVLRTSGGGLKRFKWGAVGKSIVA